MKVTLVSHTPNPQWLIETCARISYESKNDPFDPKVNSEFIRKLVKNGHESPLEHASATFLIEGISRACSHQIVRHRLASFSQRSARYVDETFRDGFSVTDPRKDVFRLSDVADKWKIPGEGTGTLVPVFEAATPRCTPPEGSVKVEHEPEVQELIEKQKKALEKCEAKTAYDVWWNYWDAMTDMYVYLTCMGVPKEDVRLYFPQGMHTALYMTANFREWRHFLKLRLDRHAQWEIRAVAREILRQLCVDGMYDCFADIQAEFDSEAGYKSNASSQPDNDKVVDMLKGRRFTEDQLTDIERIVSTGRDALRMDSKTGDRQAEGMDK